MKGTYRIRTIDYEKRLTFSDLDARILDKKNCIANWCAVHQV